MTDAGPTWESLPQSALTAEQILARFVDLVIAAGSMRDLTEETIGRGMDLDLRHYDDGDVGTYGRLTSEWSYSLRLFVELIDGPMLRLSFLAKDRSNQASRDELLGLDLEEFADRLAAAGFSSERRYGSHGSILGDDFVRDSLTLHVGFSTAITDNEPRRQTIRWVTVD